MLRFKEFLCNNIFRGTYYSWILPPFSFKQQYSKHTSLKKYHVHRSHIPQPPTNNLQNMLSTANNLLLVDFEDHARKDSPSVHMCAVHPATFSMEDSNDNRQDLKSLPECLRQQEKPVFEDPLSSHQKWIGSLISTSYLKIFPPFPTWPYSYIYSLILPE